MRPVVRTTRGVIFRHFKQILPLLRRELTYGLGWRPDDETAVGKYFALGDERAGADQTAFADGGAVEHDRLDADQGAVAHRAAMHHGLMADRYIDANRQRETWIGVQHRRVLHIAMRADAYGLVIAP